MRISTNLLTISRCHFKRPYLGKCIPVCLLEGRNSHSAVMCHTNCFPGNICYPAEQRDYI